MGMKPAAAVRVMGWLEFLIAFGLIGGGLFVGSVLFVTLIATTAKGAGASAAWPVASAFPISWTIARLFKFIANRCPKPRGFGLAVALVLTAGSLRVAAGVGVRAFAVGLSERFWSGTEVAVLGFAAWVAVLTPFLFYAEKGVRPASWLPDQGEQPREPQGWGGK